jgi:ribonuclease HI
VDGSYDDSIKKYAFGCVFLLPDGRIFTEFGNGDNPQSLAQRNVTGEMLGAMYAVRFAILNGFSEIEIRYDYQGIEKWVTGEWRSRTELTGKYAQAMRQWGNQIAMYFTKVAAHTNVTYNELADKMAKRGLTEGNGVPKVRRIEDMEEYHG